MDKTHLVNYHILKISALFWIYHFSSLFNCEGNILRKLYLLKKLGERYTCFTNSMIFPSQVLARSSLFPKVIYYTCIFTLSNSMCLFLDPEEENEVCMEKAVFIVATLAVMTALVASAVTALTFVKKSRANADALRKLDPSGLTSVSLS